MNFQSLLAKANDAGDVAGGFVVIAVCIGLCILMNLPKEKITEWVIDVTKTEKYR